MDDKDHKQMSKQIVKIKGQYFFTAGYMKEQMSWLMDCISRAKRIATCSMVITALFALLSLVAIATR